MNVYGTIAGPDDSADGGERSWAKKIACSDGNTSKSMVGRLPFSKTSRWRLRAEDLDFDDLDLARNTILRRQIHLSNHSGMADCDR
jgi:hypothetical protein